MEQYSKLLDILAIITWLGGGNYVLYSSMKRQGLPFVYYFKAFSVLKGNDWLKLLGLIVLSFIIMIIRFNLSEIK